LELGSRIGGLTSRLQSSEDFLDLVDLLLLYKGWGSVSSSSPELSGEMVLEIDAAGVASAAEEALVAGREGSRTGDFLVNEEEMVVFFKSRVVAMLFSTESAITARAANAAAAGLIVEVAMADRGSELRRIFGGETGICGDVLTSLPFTFSSTLCCR
jgi:hypothetical protein